MTDLDSRLTRLVAAGAPPDVSDLERRSSQRRARRRRRAGSIGVAVLLAGGVATWQVTDHDPPVTHVVTTEPTSAPTLTTAAIDATIRIPEIDHEVCEQITPAFSGSEDSGAYGRQPRIYAESVPPAAVQVIGHPDAFPDRYVVVLRVPNDGFQRQGWGARVEDTGVGHARTTLDDGTALYFRSRGVQESELQALVSTVTPRPLSSPIPGIDLTESTSEALQILAEEDGLSWGDGSTTTCRLEGGSEIHASVWSGSMASVYAFALDAPPPILLRQQSDGSLLRMWGYPLRHHQDVGLDDVVDASAD